MAEPSKPMPSAKAPSSSAGATATDFSEPSTSVNQSRTKRMSRSSIVRSTNSCCLSMCRSCRIGVSPGDCDMPGRRRTPKGPGRLPGPLAGACVSRSGSLREVDDVDRERARCRADGTVALTPTPDDLTEFCGPSVT